VLTMGLREYSMTGVCGTDMMTGGVDGLVSFVVEILVQMLSATCGVVCELLATFQSRKRLEELPCIGMRERERFDEKEKVGRMEIDAIYSS
jgi:hypothetical protein